MSDPAYFTLVCIAGIHAFAEALLIIVKVLAQNAGHDPQEAIIKLQQEYCSQGVCVGLDIKTGEAMLPISEGIVDNYCVKKQLLHSR